MEKKSIREWAALAEIASAIAVVVSLWFVAHTIERNTAVTQAQNDNLLYEMDMQLNLLRMSDPTFSEIFLKKERGEAMNILETYRLTAFFEQYLNMWELAWDRHRSGLLSDEKWLMWDQTASDIVTNPDQGLPRNRWSGMQTWFRPGFVQHVDAVYAAKERQGGSEQATPP